MLTFCLFLVALVSYFLGSVNGAIIASKYIFKKDIREYGSGNAGLTNFARIFGSRGVVLLLVIDLLKAAISVLFGWLLIGHYGFPMIGKLFAGFFVMLGHAFPIYYGLRGGKSVLCGGLLVIMLDWRVGLACWLVFAVTVLASRYVSLGSILAGLMLPLSVGLLGGWWLEVLLAILCGLLLVIMHWQNILRLIFHQERKINLGRLGRPRTPKES